MHAKAGAIKVVVRKKCHAPRCGKPPRVRAKAGSVVREFCAEHAQDGMGLISSTVCREPGCTKDRSHGGESGRSKRASFCARQAGGGTVDSRSKRCAALNCSARPSPSLVGSKREFCARLGRITVPKKRKECSHSGCTARPHFGMAGAKRPLLCGEHAEEGMVDLRASLWACSHPKCNKALASYGGEGRKKEGGFCAQHAVKAGSDVSSKRCGGSRCTEEASHGVAGTKVGEFCAHHAKNGMVDVRRDGCIGPGCTRRASCSVDGTKRKRACSIHASRRIKASLSEKSGCCTVAASTGGGGGESGESGESGDTPSRAGKKSCSSDAGGLARETASSKQTTLVPEAISNSSHSVSSVAAAAAKKKKKKSRLSGTTENGTRNDAAAAAAAAAVVERSGRLEGLDHEHRDDEPHSGDVAVAVASASACASPRPPSLLRAAAARSSETDVSRRHRQHRGGSSSSAAGQSRLEGRASVERGGGRKSPPLGGASGGSGNGGGAAAGVEGVAVADRRIVGGPLPGDGGRAAAGSGVGKGGGGGGGELFSFRIERSTVTSNENGQPHARRSGGGGGAGEGSGVEPTTAGGAGATRGPAAGKKRNIVFTYRFSDAGAPRGEGCAEGASGRSAFKGVVEPAESSSSAGAGAGTGQEASRSGDAKKAEGHALTEVGLRVQGGGTRWGSVCL